MKKKLAAVLAIVFLLGGCTANEESLNTDTEQEDPISIGICFDTFTIERWVKDRDVFAYTATELGADVNVQNANGDVEKQREQIQHFIEMEVDALVVVAVDADRITDLLESAHAREIAVIAYDRLIMDAPIDLYISFDNYAVGEMMAEKIAADCGEAPGVLVVAGPESDKNVPLVMEGFEAVAKEADFRIVDEVHIEGWRAENVGVYFDRNPGILEDVDAVMCGNDSLAGAVVQFLAEKRLAGTVVVTGQDADLDACQRIVEGTQTMTVYKPVEQLARQAAELTVRLACGEDIRGFVTETIDNDAGNVPYVALIPVAVDAECMDEVIVQSGFHLREDIYMNVSGEQQ